MKPSSRTILTRAPSIQEVDESLPEKLRMNQAIRYLENVLHAFKNQQNNQNELIGLVKTLKLESTFSHIPDSIQGVVEEEKKSNQEEDNLEYSQGLFQKAQSERYGSMVKSTYLLLIYCYCVTNSSSDKALEYCKLLKSNYKLNSKMAFEVKMYMAEIYISQSKYQEACRCLRIDEAFEEHKDVLGSGDIQNGYIAVQNSVTNSKDNLLPKRAIMFLNIAT